MRRREWLTGAAATTVLAGVGGGMLRLGVEPAAADVGPELIWMSPSYVTLFQSYMLVAEAKGWFRDAGLNVKIQPGTGTSVPVQLVASGSAAFGMAAPVSTCPPIADKGAPLITIGQIAYHGFFEIASRPEKPLTHPRDWQGKTIGISSVGGTTELQLDAMSMAVGLDPKNVKKVVTGLGLSGLAFLMRGDVDGFFVFYESKAALERDGAKLHYLPADDFAPLPSDALFTSTAFAQDPAKQETLVSFLRVCRRGVEYMQDEAHFDELITLLKKYNPVQAEDVDKGRRILAILRTYMRPPQGTPRLRLDDAAWAKGIALLEASGVIQSKGNDPGRFYTNKFVDLI